jgi:hypothetical protein
MRKVRGSRDHEKGQGQQGSWERSGAGIMRGVSVTRDHEREGSVSPGIMRGENFSRDHERGECQRGS